MLQRASRAYGLVASELAGTPAVFGMSTWAGRKGEPIPEISAKHQSILPAFNPPSRLLMGPGPANAHPRVLAAQSFPLLGHMHAPFFEMMNEVQEGLRYDPLLRSFCLAGRVLLRLPRSLFGAHCFRYGNRVIEVLL